MRSILMFVLVVTCVALSSCASLDDATQAPIIVESQLERPQVFKNSVEKLDEEAGDAGESPDDDEAEGQAESDVNDDDEEEPQGNFADCQPRMCSRMYQPICASVDGIPITAPNDCHLQSKIHCAKKMARSLGESLSTTSTDHESVLVLENLKPHGYRLGPRLYLNRDHLLSMCKPLGEYHALSYALRELDPAQLERLKSEIVPLPFMNDADPLDAKRNVFRVLHRAAFDRFFQFFDRKIDDNSTFDRKSEEGLKLILNLRRLRERHFEEPSRLMERLRTQVEESEEDRRWAVIIHGDFNRNNVLFAYKENLQPGEEDDKKSDDELSEVRNVKMIDFQLLRYGTPAMDLSFFMYFNTTENLRTTIWLDILKKYHSYMFDTLSDIMKAGKSDVELQEIQKELENYNFASFNSHFARYAIFGVIICLHFLPWLHCSEDECARLSMLFETDMHGDEFHKLSIEAGGDEVNLRLLDILRHACQMGYLDHI